MQLINNRQFQRVNLEASINILINDQILQGHSYDFSEGGIYIKLDKQQREYLPVGTQINLQFQGLNYQAPVIKAQVIRSDTKGCAFILLTDKSKNSAENKQQLH